MKKSFKIILLLLLVTLLCSCKPKDILNFNKTKYYRLGDLSFGMLDYIKKESQKGKNRMIFSLYNKNEDITITILRKTKMVETAQDLIDGFDEWDTNMENLQELMINDQRWFKETDDDIMWFTKYQKNIYGIKITSRRDKNNITKELEELFENITRLE